VDQEQKRTRSDPNHPNLEEDIDMKDSKRVIRGFTETSINKNIKMLQREYPTQTRARDTAVALNIAEDQAIRANRPRLVRKLSK